MVTFGPQLIGQTEKGLQALLQRVLTGPGLSEQEWVVLRLAGQNVDGVDLASVVAARARFQDATTTVDALTRRGLVERGALSDDGRALLDRLQREIATVSAPIWADLDEDDVAATERVLEAVIARTDLLLHG